MVTLVSASNRVQCAFVSRCDLEWCVSEFISGCGSLKEVVVSTVSYAVPSWVWCGGFQVYVVIAEKVFK